MTDSIPAAPILTRIENTTGVLELNRPKALNSLTPEMIDIIDEHLTTWKDDPAVTQVVVYSPTKAFCAGGDVRFAREFIEAGDHTSVDRFFAEEYVMNGDLHHFPKPYIALIDGVAMGGGLGISAHGSHRVISEKAFAAMPEMAIGYVPDVGVPYMLQRMFPGEQTTGEALATFLVVTGWHLSPADMLWSGLATHFVPSEHMEELRQAIIDEGVEVALSRFATDCAEESELARWEADIAATFGRDSWSEIQQALDNHPEFATLVKEKTAAASPTSIVAACELMAAAKLCTDIREELALETILGEDIRRRPDFVEGVRAVLVDKTRDAVFAPAADPEEFRALLRKEKA